MTTTTETQTTKTKQIPSYYIFENAADGQPGKPVGAAFAHKNGKGVTLLINGKRYAAFPPKAKTAEPAPATTEEKGA